MTRRTSKPLLRWYPDTVPPELPATALIAVIDPDGTPTLLDGIYTATVHSGGKWWREDTTEPLEHSTYFWLHENDLVASIPRGKAR